MNSKSYNYIMIKQVPLKTFLKRLRSGAYVWLVQIRQLLFPLRKCAACGDFTPDGGVCDSCRQRISEIRRCKSCASFLGDTKNNSGNNSEKNGKCRNCLGRRWHFDAANAVLPYSGELKKNLRLFKFNGRVEFARPFTDMLFRLAADVYKDELFDLVLPVPMHETRLAERGYNQAKLLSDGLRTLLNSDTDMLALICVKPLPGFAKAGPRERVALVSGAFSAKAARVGGKRILLVDDIYTTGATANECARTLKKAGAEFVAVITVAAGTAK